MDQDWRALAAPALRRTVEDLRHLVSHLTYTAVGGSVLVPRVLRWLVYRLGGARTASPPGARFTLSGSPKFLTIGRDVYFNQGVFIETTGPVTIGDGCAFGMQSMIVTSSHPLDAGGRWKIDSVGLPVVLGDSVWVGARAVVLPGVTIASGVVIAAGAVVTKDCAVRGVYGGVPARLLKEFADDPGPVPAGYR